MTLFRVTREKISINEVVSHLSSPSIGAVTTFVGIVRGTTDGKQVQYLEYEAYAGMADDVLRQIGGEIKTRWQTIEQVAIVHRIGRLEVGEVSVVVALSAAHRTELFDALHYAIDRLKEIVPIWKKEVYTNGSEWKSEFV
jgi:molybdopterin synthase catalytic subunit